MEARPGRYFDGATAGAHEVDVVLRDTELLIRTEDRVVARWDLDGLRRLPATGEDGQSVYKETGGLARLVVDDAGLQTVIARAAPALDHSEPVPGQLRRAAIWAGGAIGSVLIIVFVIVPALAGQLAAIIPVERERQLGEAALEQLDWVLGRFGREPVAFCTGEPGVVALRKMTDRIVGDLDHPYDLNVQVMPHDMVNAFALPGGHVVIMRGLIRAAETPEEVAGVLAHEIGHVVHRDPTRLALRSAGTVGVLGLLLGDFSGGTAVLAATERLVAASYSQDAETSADAFAVERMGKAGLPARALGTMFERLGGLEEREPGVLNHLASHPDLASRAEAARDGDVIGSGIYEPVLAKEEWLALRRICKPEDVSSRWGE